MFVLDLIVVGAVDVGCLFVLCSLCFGCCCWIL